MLLSYYTKICIPIVGLNIKQPDLHYKIMVHNTEHKHVSDTVKIVIYKVIYPIIIQYIEHLETFDNILLTARSPPEFSGAIMLCSYYYPNIRRW